MRSTSAAARIGLPKHRRLSIVGQKRPHGIAAFTKMFRQKTPAGIRKFSRQAESCGVTQRLTAGQPAWNRNGIPAISNILDCHYQEDTMTNLARLSEDYERVERAIQYLEENVHRQPALSDVAESAGLSEFHFQRLFSRWVGIIPKRFLQFLTKEYAKQLITSSSSILDAAYEAGLSGPGRLHDLMVSSEAVTPGELKRRGEGIRISYGFHPSPFGKCLLAVTKRGICGLRFVNNSNEPRLVEWLRQRWLKAAVLENPEETRHLSEKVFDVTPQNDPLPLYLYIKGTNFQIQVWEALLKIPMGNAVTYQDIARHLGMPNAARAVGNAVGANPIPFLIPCHRVIRKMGEFGNYGEGPARKKALLGWEAVRAADAATPAMV